MNRIVFLLITITLLITAGCGGNFFEGLTEDKNSSEAKEIDISNKLDRGDYEAILNDPDANALDYAAAAMGKAGLNPVDLLNSLNDIASGTSQTATNDISSIVENLKIDPDAIGYLQEAKGRLDKELEANPDDPDLNLQMVATSLTSTITVIANVGQNLPGVVLEDGIDETEAQIIGNNITDATSLGDVDGDGNPDNAVSIIANDVVNVAESLPAANLGSDLDETLTDIATKPNGLNYECQTDTSGKCLKSDPVTDSDISSYLLTTFGTP